MCRFISTKHRRIRRTAKQPGSNEIRLDSTLFTFHTDGRIYSESQHQSQKTNSLIDALMLRNPFLTFDLKPQTKHLIDL